MKLTRDESRILGELLNESKYELNHKNGALNGYFEALLDLENRLIEAGKDRRRSGRTSQDSYIDCEKRFAQSYIKKREQ